MGTVTSEILFHNHRIVPGHMGGTYAKRNVLKCNVAMHAYLHRVLWEQHGQEEDRKAWRFLTSMIGRDDTQRRQLATAFNKERWTDPAFRAKMIHAQSNPSAAVRRERSSRMKGNDIARGRVKSEAERAAVSARMKGNTFRLGSTWTPSPETRERFRLAALAREKKKRDARG